MLSVMSQLGAGGEAPHSCPGSHGSCRREAGPIVCPSGDATTRARAGEGTSQVSGSVLASRCHPLPCPHVGPPSTPIIRARRGPEGKRDGLGVGPGRSLAVSRAEEGRAGGRPPPCDFPQVDAAIYIPL